MKPKPPTSGLIDLLPTEIVADEAWNSRGRPDPGVPEMSDAELETSIRESGLLQPLRVRMLNGAWHLVFGFRRLRACLRVAPEKKVPCTIMPTATGDYAADDLRARLENLGENGQRLALKPYELADAVYRLRQLHIKTTFKEIAEWVGKSEDHVEKLCRLRSKLCPELLEAWQLNPDRHAINDLSAITSYAHGDQVAAYNGRKKDRRGGRPKGSKTARPVNLREVATWKEEVQEAHRHAHHEEAIYLEGMKAALEAVESGDWNLKRIMK